MSEKTPICTGKSEALGQYSIYETANKARLYIISEKFGNMPMQGRENQARVRQMLKECMGEDLPEEVPETPEPVEKEEVPESVPETPEKSEKKRRFFNISVGLFGK